MASEPPDLTTVTPLPRTQEEANSSEISGLLDGTLISRDVLAAAAIKRLRADVRRLKAEAPLSPYAVPGEIKRLRAALADILGALDVAGAHLANSRHRMVSARMRAAVALEEERS